MATTDIAQLQREVVELRTILQQHPNLYKNFYKQQCVEALSQTTLFSEVPEKYLMMMAEKMKREEFQPGHFVCHDGLEVDQAFIIASGEVRRWARDEAPGGRPTQVNTFCDRSVGTLHLYNVETAARYNAECATPVVAYCLTRKDLDEIIMKNPEVSHHMIRSLSKYIRSQSKRYVTPLFETKGHKTSFTTTTIAATVESFFRSGMNSLINQKLTGEKSPLFPQMHVQIPVRVIYLNGLKQIRSLAEDVDCNTHPYPAASRAALTFLPGVVMCPFSSVLEASNATKNSTPMYKRWTQGYTPRLAREVIFALGMNQLADFFSERLVFIEHDFTRHCTGSISAGLVAGYFSHIPHVMSTMKLMNPDKKYSELWFKVWQKGTHRVPVSIPAGSALHSTTAQLMALLMPIGMIRRSTQIAGTFMIVNGLTYALRDKAKDWY